MLHCEVTLTSLASGRHWLSQRDCRVAHARPHPGRGRRGETQQLTANLKQLTENLTLHTLHPLSPHTHTPTHITHTPPLQFMTSHYTHPPPTHVHTHTPPLQIMTSHYTYPHMHIYTHIHIYTHPHAYTHGAKSVRTSMGLQTSPFRAVPYKADMRNLRKFGATYSHGTTFAPKKYWYQKEATGMESPHTSTTAWPLTLHTHPPMHVHTSTTAYDLTTPTHPHTPPHTHSPPHTSTTAVWPE